MLLNCGVGEDSLEFPGVQGDQTSQSTGNQSWIFIGRTDAEAETPTLWPPGAKSWLIGKDPDAGKDWRQEEKRTTEDEMVGWYHWLDGHEFEQVLGAGDGQGSLVCCSPWGHKQSDTTEWLNWTELNWVYFLRGLSFKNGMCCKWNLRDRHSRITKSHKYDSKEFDREAWCARFMGSQRVGHNWASELNWTEGIWTVSYIYSEPNDWHLIEECVQCYVFLKVSLKAE